MLHRFTLPAIVFGFLLTLAVGCSSQSTATPPADPDAVKREAKRVAEDIQKERNSGKAQVRK